MLDSFVLLADWVADSAFVAVVGCSGLSHCSFASFVDSTALQHTPQARDGADIHTSCSASAAKWTLCQATGSACGAHKDSTSTVQPPRAASLHGQGTPERIVPGPVTVNTCQCTTRRPRCTHLQEATHSLPHAPTGPASHLVPTCRGRQAKTLQLRHSRHVMIRQPRVHCSTSSQQQLCMSPNPCDGTNAMLPGDAMRTPAMHLWPQPHPTM